jgi:glycosyltransferase involved in cell wall biosynthesis
MERITVVIPTIPARVKGDLLRAVNSVEEQTYPRHLVDTHIVTDQQGLGPARMRNVGSSYSTTDWIAFLDDDDYLLPDHLDVLMREALEHEADVVWPWFRVEGGTDPFPQRRGKQWDPEEPHCFPITTLVRKSKFEEVGGFISVDEAIPDPNDPLRWVSGEDWRLWLSLSAAGAKFHHIDQVTWVWRHHGKNTSGLPERVKEMYG